MRWIHDDHGDHDDHEAFILVVIFVIVAIFVSNRLSWFGLDIIRAC